MTSLNDRLGHTLHLVSGGSAFGRVVVSGVGDRVVRSGASESMIVMLSEEGTTVVFGIEIETAAPSVVEIET